MTLIADNYLLPIFASYAVIRPNIDKQISMIIIKLSFNMINLKSQYGQYQRVEFYLIIE